jgi:hypothetical protein
MKPVPVGFFCGQRSRFLPPGKKIESGVSWKKHRKLERASVRFAQKNQNQRREDSFFFREKGKSDFSDPASERFPPRGAVSRFAKRRNRRGKRVECRKPRNGSFRTDTRFLGGCVGPMRRATLPSVARPGRVRAVRARAGLERIPGVPSTSIVANVSRSSCVAVSERRACAVFDRSVRRDPEASFQTGVGHFLRVEVRDERARGRVRARGRHHGGARGDHRGRLDPPVARPPPARARDSESGEGRGLAGPIRFFSQVAFWRAPLDSRIEKTVVPAFDKILGEVEKIWKSAARRQKAEK